MTPFTVRGLSFQLDLFPRKARSSFILQPSAFPWSLLPLAHEATLYLALAAIPIGTTIIHPALGLACTLATLRTVYHLGQRCPAS